jgi:error-prone DNA polymerase
MLRRTRPRNLDDLSVEVAIVRPGPIVGGAVNPYVRRREAQRQAAKEGRPYHPPLDHPLLAEALWDEFRDGAAARGVPEPTARRVFEQVIAFSEFGFPKSHAVAFGLLAYQSAWLKHYHPVEYYVGLFNNQPMGFYSLDALSRDARRHGVAVVLPDVNRSDVWSTVEADRQHDVVRVGLGFIRDWGSDIAEEVVLERERNGPYRSLGDLIRRSPPGLSRLAIDNLVWVGGCDEFGLTRRELLWQAGLWLPPRNDRTDPARVRHQLELALNHPHEQIRFGDLAADERLVAEYGMLGFAPSGHPLSLLRGALPPGVVQSDALPTLEHDASVQIVGLVVARQRPHTAKGYVFVLMEDEAGMINVIVKPDIFDRDRIAIRGEPFLWVIGRLARDDGSLNVIAEEVRALRTGNASREAPDSQSSNPFSFLRALRQHAPDSKDWG